MRSQWLFDAYRNFPGQLVVSAPMWPANQGSLSECATGAYDSRWATLGKTFVANNRASAILRLGWEANGDFMYWSAGERSADGSFRSTALGASQYRECFRRVVAAVRTSAPRLVIDWTVNAHDSPTCNGRATNCYPGDDVVDIVGIDTYDMWPVSRDQAEFDRQANQAEGITAMYNFARGHGKLFSVPEWGVAPGASGGGGFDNPFYVTAMISWFAAHAKYLAYEAYFNICQSEVKSDIYACGPINPKAGAAYRAKLTTF
jgi:beta-mannanase